MSRRYVAGVHLLVIVHEPIRIALGVPTSRTRSFPIGLIGPMELTELMELIKDRIAQIWLECRSLDGKNDPR